MKGKNIQYLPAIDQLRGIAALLIIVYHGLHVFSYHLRFGKPFAFDNWLQSENVPLAALLEGHTAVTLFMVLSGFIFTYGTFGAQIRYGDFIYNRVLRIFPLFVLIYVVGIYAFPQSYSFVGLLQGLLLQGNLPGSAYIEPFTALFWTIAVEFQFYLLFPFLMSFQQRYGLRYLLLVILVCLIFRGIAVVLGANARDLSYTTIVGRLDQFALGMIIAVLAKRRPIRGAAAVAGLIAATAGLIGALSLFNQLGGYPLEAWYKILWPDLEGALWAAFIFFYLGVFNQLKTPINRLLGWIGLISYSLYLTHLIIVQVITRLDLMLARDQPFQIAASLTTLALALPLSLALATITYYVVERPFLELRRMYLIRPEAGEPISRKP